MLYWKIEEDEINVDYLGFNWKILTSSSENTRYILHKRSMRIQYAGYFALELVGKVCSE